MYFHMVRVVYHSKEIILLSWCIMEHTQIQYFFKLLQDMAHSLRENGELMRENMSENGEIFADPADRASAESDKAFALRLRDRERQLLRKIEEAIGRIEEGRYGICEECGENISVARLKARPVTQLCIECKSKQEERESQYRE